MNSINNDWLLFDFNQVKEQVEQDTPRELRRLKRYILNQYLFEVRNGDGFQEAQINRVFGRCFSQYVRELKSSTLPRCPNISLVDLARSRTHVLRLLIENALQERGLNASDKDEVVSESDSEEGSYKRGLQRQMKKNRLTQKRLREEIAEVKDELEEHQIHQEHENPNVVQAEFPQQDLQLSLPPRTKKRKIQFDPSDPEHLIKRLDSQKKYIRGRKELLSDLKSQVRSFEKKMDLSSLTEEEWKPPVEDSESLVQIDSLVEQARVEKVTQEREFEQQIQQFRALVNMNNLDGAYHVFQSIPYSLREEFYQRHGIEIQGDQTIVDCKWCTKESGWKNLMIAFIVSDTRKITIHTNSDEIRSFLRNILLENYRSEWLTVILRNQQISLFKRGQ